MSRRQLAAIGLAVAMLGLLVAGCRRQLAPGSVLEIVPDEDWPLLVDDLEPESFAAAADQSLAYFHGLPPERNVELGGARFTVAELQASLDRLRGLLSSERDPVRLAQALREGFVLAQSVGRDGRGEVLFTGYYEPVLEASRVPQAAFVQPVYELPRDLVSVNLEDFGVESEVRQLVGRVEDGRLVRYPDREAIDFNAALAGQAQAIAYLPDPVQTFFLHVQGSGQLCFADGSRVRVGYASGNGHPYRSIGRLLLDEGLLTADEMSMQAIQEFLAHHPEQVRRVLSYNPSYVFFRVLAPEGGPLGCYELPLTAGRSIATDRGLFPAPVPAFIQGVLPTADGGEAPLSRFVLNQDTGGAIKGAGRVDLFFGSGDAAGERAGRTKHLGRLFFLLPRV